MRVLSLVFLITFLTSVCFADIINIPEDFDTIQEGIDAAEPGTMVLVQPGEYVENLRILTPVRLFGNPADPGSVIIDGSNGGDSGSVIYSNIEVEGRLVITGFTICNGTGTVNDVGESFAGAYLGRDDYATIFDRCILRDNSAYRFGVAYVGWRGWNEGEIRHAPRFRHCEFYRNESGGVLIYYSGSLVIPEEEPLFEHCIFRENRSWGLIDPSMCMSGVIDHCSMVDNEIECVLLNDCTRLLVTNSISWGNEGEEGRSYMYGGGVSDNYPLIISWSDIEGGEDAFRGDFVEYRENNIESDPLFVDPENGNYHITADSPCIDAGDPESDPDPDGTRADIGAFHFHQRDIDVNPLEVQFPPTDWDVLDSLSVTISNIGRTELTIDSIAGSLDMSCIWMNEENPDEWEPILIEPQSGIELWMYYRPQMGAVRVRTFWIFSDDPDEPEVILQAEGDVIDAVSDDCSVPDLFQLNAIYPNPFNSSTTITYDVPKQSSIALEVYNIRGQLVDVLLDRVMPAGRHSVVLDGREFCTGMYLVKIKKREDGTEETRKLGFVK